MKKPIGNFDHFVPLPFSIGYDLRVMDAKWPRKIPLLREMTVRGTSLLRRPDQRVNLKYDLTEMINSHPD